MSMDPDEAEMFIEAQDDVWKDVIRELSAGQKESHWMWFVFPQLASLGQSNMSQLFGLHDLAEATDFAAHPVLGARLVEVTKLVLAQSGTSAKDMFGNVDAMKLRSSMTLFAATPNADAAFQAVIDTFFDGAPCPQTQSEIA